ncbi:MAG: cytochrome c biogenesis protein [Candidatus Marinimicrobia bacterium]|nr:cytochrome c biogenesis protein [Candidatus Neomarinimicrobiota bacterium]MCF7827766.1 cytochrome c biogenesis protein [Candidatus Neomarinimicrobiota bacterium]MCF7879479.1 cytochrome c biogenesis protein [Candidatus Neomarinimicrobiota bacterium]
MINLLNILLPVFYLATAILYAIHFFADEVDVERYLTPLLIVTLLIHAADLTLRTVAYQHFPTASPAEVMTVIAFAMALIYLWIESILSVKTTGVFVIGLVAIFQVASSATIEFIPDINPILQSPLFSVHTGSAILGYSSIAISALYALLYLLLFYDIKGSRFSVFYNQLPSLEVLDAMNTKAATAGFTFLTITIFLGAVWTKIAFEQLIVFDWKIMLALITWAIFGFVIASKRWLGWSGKRIAYVSLTGFTTVVISMTVVNYFLTSFHKFY